MRESDIELTVRDLAVGGDAIANLPDGCVIFLDRGLPGDVVLARIDVRKKRFARGTVQQVKSRALAPDPDPCKHAEDCGGCRLWACGYADGWTHKVAAVEGTLGRIARDVTWPSAERVPSPIDRGYRHRVRMLFRTSGANGLSGYRRARSHEVVTIEHCAVAFPPLDAVRQQIAQRWTFGDAEVHLDWDAVRGGALIAVRLERPRVQRDPITRAPIVAKSAVTLQSLAQALASVPNLLGIAGLNGDGSTMPIPGFDTQVHRRIQIPGGTQVGVQVPVASFSQGHAELNEQLQQLVCTMASCDGLDTIDLFSGYGNLTFPLHASGPARLTGFEGIAEPVQAGNVAASNHGIAVDFSVADLGEPTADTLARIAGAEVVVMDPPREGVNEALCDAMGTGSAKRIVYVSCDPPAMARDVGRLAKHGFQVARLVLLDMFPRTPHVEAVVLLER